MRKKRNNDADITPRRSCAPVALAFERERNWRFYEKRIREIVERGNTAYEVCLVLADAKRNLDKIAFLRLVESTGYAGYTRATINRWVEVGTDARFKNPGIADLLPVDAWRLYALHQIEDQAAFEAALHGRLGVREMDALRKQKDPSVPIDRDLAQFKENQICNVDCFDVFERLEEKKVLFDYIVTDPPTGKTKKHFDVAVPTHLFLMHCERLLKPRGALTLVITDLDIFREYLNPGHKFFSNSRDWIWNYTLPNNFMNASNDALHTHAYVLTLSNGVPTFNPQRTIGKPYERERPPSASSNYGRGATPTFTHNTGRRHPVSVLRIPSVPTQKRIHQQQKPVKLFRKLIRTFTNEGEYVLDPFAGSGTAGIASIQSGRKFLLFKKDTENLEKAEERLKRYRSRLRL